MRVDQRISSTCFALVSTEGVALVMKLRDFVSVDRVVVPLRASTLSEATEALLACLESSGAVRDSIKLRRRIEESRGEDLVVIAGRAFLLHFRAEAVAELRVALGVASAPLVRGNATDEPRARVVVLIVAPPREAARHVQVVRGFARLFSKVDALDTILAAPTAGDLVALKVLEQFTLPEELTVRDLMTERPRTTTPDMPLRDAAREMYSSGLSALPVVDDDGGLLGLL